MDNTVCTDNADYGVCSGVARVFDIGADPEFVSPVHANIKNVAHPQKKKKRGGGVLRTAKKKKCLAPGRTAVSVPSCYAIGCLYIYKEVHCV